MNTRREMFGTAVMLAAALSAIAGAVVIALDSLGVASQPILILSVIVIGFTTSWVQSGRIAHVAEPDLTTASAGN